MADFYKAIDYVLESEGGLVDNPSDPGGVTNFGIAQRSHPNVNVRDLTRAEAIDLYRSGYWRFDGIASQRVATKIFDFYVNMPPTAAVKVAQRAIARVQVGPVVVDGRWGPQTEGAINAVQDEDKFLAALVDELKEHYAAVVAANPSQAVFEKGWTARAEKLPA